MGVAEVRRLKQLEEENGKLKRLVADLTLDKAMLKDARRKKWCSPSVAARSSGTSRRLTPSRNAGRAGPVASDGLPTDTSRAAIRGVHCG